MSDHASWDFLDHPEVLRILGEATVEVSDDIGNSWGQDDLYQDLVLYFAQRPDLMARYMAELDEGDTYRFYIRAHREARNLSLPEAKRQALQEAYNPFTDEEV